MPPLKPAIDGRAVTESDAVVAADALFDQVYIDRERLAANVRRALQARSQVSLGELLEAYPLEQGLAELLAYFGMAAEDRRHVIDDDERQTVAWTDRRGLARQATLPLVVYQRS